MFDAIGSSGGDLLGTIISNRYADARQDSAQQFSAEQYAHRYRTTVNDLKEAGLNPMLAYGQGAGNAPSSSAAGAASGPDLGSSAARGKLTSAQSAVAEKQLENIEADTVSKRALSNLYQAQATQANATAAQATGNINLMDFQTKKIAEELKNIPKEGNRLDALVQQLGASANLMREQGASQANIRSHLEAMVSKLKSETKMLNFDIKAVEDTSGYGRLAREVKPISDIGADWLSPSRIIDHVLSGMRSSSTETHTDIIRDSEGRHTGSSSYSTKKGK